MMQILLNVLNDDLSYSAIIIHKIILKPSVGCLNYSVYFHCIIQLWAYTHTCTQLTHVAHHSNVIMMTTVLQWSFNFVVRALLQLFLFATAGHIGQPDLATSGAIVARIHWLGEWKPQLATDYSSLCKIPGVTADRSPHSIQKDLYTTRVGVGGASSIGQLDGPCCNDWLRQWL